MAIEKNMTVHILKDSGNKNIEQRLKFSFAVCLTVVLLVSTRSNINAQDRLELGPLLGASYYFGDLNHGIPFKDPHLAIGGLARYVFTDRIAVRGSVVYAGLSGSYDPADGVLPGVPVNYSFNRHVGDIAVMAEINLFSYDHKFIPTTVFTPYLSLGIGTVLYKRAPDENDKSVFVLSLPFGVGVKYKMNKWVRIGAEWSFRKLFTDDIEGDMYPGGDKPFYENNKIHNDDWFSVADVFITFSFLRRRSSCQGGY